jgi:hypothetical protein
MSLQKMVQPPIAELLEEAAAKARAEVYPPVRAASHPKSSAVDVVLSVPAKRFRVRWADLAAAVLTGVLVVLGILAFEGQMWALWAMLAVAWSGTALIVAVSVGRVIRSRDREVHR